MRMRTLPSYPHRMRDCTLRHSFYSLQLLMRGFSRKRDCISQLLYRMCEENAVDRLMALNFAGLADEVEDALAFKARNADPRIRPFYSRILYTWYVSRGDYRNGESAPPHIAVCSAVLTAR